MFSCSNCPAKFDSSESFQQHEEKSKINNYCNICTQCEEPIFTLKDFKTHVKLHCGENLKKYSCTQCDTSFVNKNYLAVHARTHSGEKPFTCNVCKVSFKQFSHLTTHARTHTNEKPFLCTSCPAKFSQSSSLKRHMRSHTGEKPYSCTLCDRSFSDKRNLTRHMFKHNGIRPFTCDKCGASFTQMIDLKRHFMSHTGLKPYKCDICDASFSRNNNLSWHKLTHEGDTPYFCTNCSIGFKKMRDLKQHMKSHSNKNKLRISNATHDKSSSESDSCANHVKINNERNSYQCELCPSSYFDKYSYRRHIYKHENEKPHKCDLCDGAFYEVRLLKRHKVTVHGEKRFPDTLSSESVNDHEETNENDYTTKEELCSDETINISNTAIVNSSYIQISDSEPNKEATLILSNPGEPTKAYRIAGDCPNHQNHVFTFVENSTNQWQSWCFCASTQDNTLAVNPQGIDIQISNTEENSSLSQADGNYIKLIEASDSNMITVSNINTPIDGNDNNSVSMDIPNLDLKSMSDDDTDSHITDSSINLDASIDKNNKYQHESNKKIFSCAECDQVFIRKMHLKVHMRKHTGERPYKCTKCSASFTHQNTLTAHIRFHTGEKPFACDLCSATFSQKSNLTVHRRIHTGEKPYSCELCGLSFRQASHLPSHRRTHFNERPYVCSECGKNFTQQSALTRHMHTHRTKPKKSFPPAAEINNEMELNDATKVTQNSLDINEQTVDNTYENSIPKVTKKIKKNKAIKRKSKKLDNKVIRKKEKDSSKSVDLKAVFRAVLNTPHESSETNTVSKEACAADDVQSWCFCGVPHENDEPHSLKCITDNVNHSINTLKCEVLDSTVMNSEISISSSGTIIATDDCSHKLQALPSGVFPTVYKQESSALSSEKKCSIVGDAAVQHITIMPQMEHTYVYDDSLTYQQQNISSAVASVLSQSETVPVTGISSSHAKYECCSFCNFICQTTQELERHVCQNYAIQTYACGNCRSAFDSLHSLNTHICKEPSILCTTDDQAKNQDSTQIVVAFQNLKESHDETVNNSLVETVPKSASVKSPRIWHPCTFCTDRFTSKSDLDRHNRQHTGAKPYQCSTCNTRFTRKSSLNKHEKIHSGVKSFSCSQCSAKFTYKYQLYKHKSTHCTDEESSSGKETIS